MKKLIAICAVALSMGAFADSYLYWMLEESDSMSWANNKAPTNYDSARIGVLDSSYSNVGYLNLYTGNGDAISGNALTGIDKAVGSAGTYAKFDSQTTGYSFYIELLSSSKYVGRSEIFTYDALSNYITSNIGGTSSPSAGSWAPTSFTTAPVPEPTSGLLMLFGLSALALRRKRPLKA